MPLLSIATTAVATPMGAQVYEEEVASRAPVALAAIASGWRVHRTIVRSLRSPLSGNRRVPMAALASADVPVRRLAGQFLYPRGAVVHRMALELPPPPGPDIVTLHDTVAWKYSDEAPPVRAAIAELRRADAVVCVSAFTAQEAVDLLGIQDPIVIHNGVDPAFFEATPLSPEQRAALSIPRPYVLHAGGASLRKNLEGLAAAWPLIAAARPDLWLVMSGPEHPRRTRLFAGLPRVRLVGRVPPALVPGLFASADVVVVPSHHAGFGLPALEAMAAGTPVVAADTSSLPEVVGDCGVLVAQDGASIATGVLDVLGSGSDAGLLAAAGRVRARQFTWEASAAAHARVWSSGR